jgi:hypothetical protein
VSSATQDSMAAGAGFSADMSGITPPSMPGRRGAFLSDIIVELGFADREVVEEAVPAAASAGKTVGRFLLDNGVLSDEQLSIAIAERSGLEHVDLDRFDVDSSAATLIGRSVAMRYNALPIAFAPDGALVVAVADPSDFLGISDIEVMAKTEVRLAVANPERIQELIEHLPEPEPSHDAPEPPGPPPDLQADLVAVLDGVRTADANGDSAGDEAVSAKREDKVDREELEQLRGRLADITEARERQGQELEQLRGQLADVTGERERLGQELEQLRGQAADVTGERDRLRGQIGDAANERQRLERELELAAEERERLSTEAEGVEPCEDRAGGEAPAEAEPLNTVALDQVTLDMRKGTATVRARVDGVGHLLLTGRGVQDSCTATDGVESATLAVVPAGKKKRRLEATGRAKVEVSVMFVPASGDLRTQAMAIPLVKRMDQ